MEQSSYTPIIVKSFKEVTEKYANCNSLYVAEDAEHAFVFCLIVAEARILGKAYSGYNNVPFLQATVCVLDASKANDLPDTITAGFYYSHYTSFSKYRSSYPFPYTNAKYSDAEVSLYLDRAKEETGFTKVKIENRKDLKKIWNEVTFHLCWLRERPSELVIAEEKLYEKKNEEESNKVNKLIDDVFGNLPNAVRQKNYYSSGYTNEWNIKIPDYDEYSVRFRLGTSNGKIGIIMTSPFWTASKFVKEPYLKNIQKIITAHTEFCKQIKSCID